MEQRFTYSEDMDVQKRTMRILELELQSNFENKKLKLKNPDFLSKWMFRIFDESLVFSERRPAVERTTI